MITSEYAYRNTEDVTVKIGCHDFYQKSRQPMLLFIIFPIASNWATKVLHLRRTYDYI